MDISTQTFRLAVALGIGLLVGMERERRKVERGLAAAEGIRTFALVSVAGGVAQLLGGQLVLVAGGMGVVVMIAAAYLRRPIEESGITTEIATITTYLLGALAIVQPEVAGPAGIAVTMLLAFRKAIHTFVRSTLAETELRDGLIFASAAFVILPLLPNRAIDAYGVVNPSSIWRTVVVFMAVSGAGYIAVRFLGPRFGLPVAGFFAGFVSSTAAVGSMASLARRTPALLSGAVGGAVLASVASIMFLLALVAATSIEALRAAAWPMGAAGGVAVIYAVAVALRTLRTPSTESSASPGRAFDLRAAVGFALLVTAISFIAALLTDRFGASGLFLAAAVAGFADTHAAAIGAASLVVAGHVAGADAALAMTLALTTNQVTKFGLAWSLARGRYAILVGVGLVAMVGAAWVGALLAPR